MGPSAWSRNEGAREHRGGGAGVGGLAGAEDGRRRGGALGADKAEVAEEFDGRGGEEPGPGDAAAAGLPKREIDDGTAVAAALQRGRDDDRAEQRVGAVDLEPGIAEWLLVGLDAKEDAAGISEIGGGEVARGQRREQ